MEKESDRGTFCYITFLLLRYQLLHCNSSTHTHTHWCPPFQKESRTLLGVARHYRLSYQTCHCNYKVALSREDGWLQHCCCCCLVWLTLELYGWMKMSGIKNGLSVSAVTRRSMAAEKTNVGGKATTLISNDIFWRDKSFDFLGFLLYTISIPRYTLYFIGFHLFV